jgi:hypothetical protein
MDSRYERNWPRTPLYSIEPAGSYPNKWQLRAFQNPCIGSLYRRRAKRERVSLNTAVTLLARGLGEGQTHGD